MEHANQPPGRRCRAAIVRGREVLLLQHQHRGFESTYWWFPGGGRKPGESDEACVIREVKEEVGLDVRVGRPLDLPQAWRDGNHAVYLCTPLPGEVQLGTEDEHRDLVGFGWYPIDDESTWEPEFYEDHIHPVLEAIRREIT